MANRTRWKHCKQVRFTDLLSVGTKPMVEVSHISKTLVMILSFSPLYNYLFFPPPRLPAASHFPFTVTNLSQHLQPPLLLQEHFPPITWYRRPGRLAEYSMYVIGISPEMIAILKL